MSKMFDYISGKSEGKVAELEASVEHTAGYLGVEIADNQRLRAALKAIVDEPHTWKMRKIAREAIEQ